MTAIRVGIRHFTGNGRVYDTDPLGLGAIVRGIAIDLARTKIEAAGVADLTDNTTGTAGTQFLDLNANPALYNATSAGGVQQAAFATTIGKIKNIQKVLVNSLNNARSRIGLRPLVAVEGTQASSNVLPAQDLTTTTASGTSAVNYASMIACLAVIKANHRKLLIALNEFHVAIGVPAVTNKLSGILTAGVTSAALTLVAIPAVVADSTGATSVAKTDGDAFLTNMANNYATLAALYNLALTQGSVGSLTDSTTGTSNGDTVAALVATPLVGYTDVSTSSAPSAGLNTQIALYRNAVASLAATVNILLEENSLPLLTDSTTGTASSTLAALSHALTATTGASDATLTTTNAFLTALSNNVSTLITAINLLAPNFGVSALTDSSGGTTSPTKTLVAMANTAAADNTSTPIGVQNTAANTILQSTTNAIATLAAKVNAMVGANAPQQPLHVVAV